MRRAGWRWRGVTALLCAAELVTTPVAARAQEPATPPTTPAPAITAPPAPSAPEATPALDQAAALAHFREGKQYYAERRYAEAAEAFDRSLAAAWSINAAYNKALSLDKAGDLVGAVTAYRDYLAHAEVDDQHRSAALQRSEQFRQRLGEVLLQLDSPEAIREIRINGVEVGADAFPWLTLPGPLDVEFIGEAPGQRKNVRADVRAGGTVTIVFPGFLRPQARPAEPLRPPGGTVLRQDSRRQKALQAGFWTTTSLAIAGGATVAILGSRVLVYGRRERAVCDPMCDAAETIEKNQLRSDFATFKTATNVAIVVSTALGVAALALGIAWKRERPRSPASTRAGLRWLGSAVELTF